MDAKRRARATYEAASDHYDRTALSFWERFGRRSVERIQLSPGARVLDVCCGTGASALPAAEILGPQGRVLAVDLAANQLARGRGKAVQRGLSNLEFRQADVETLDLSDGSFDAAICVFGIFFLPDMARATEKLYRLVRAGGNLAITTWGTAAFEPANTVFWDAVGERRPDLYKGFNPWDQIDTPEKLHDLFDAAGVPGAKCVAEPGEHAVGSPEDWRTIVMGSGYRGTVDQLSREDAESVRSRCTAFIRDEGVDSVTTNVVYGVATRPSPG